MAVLRDMEVLLLDGQTTGASPQHGHLLELCWARARASDERPIEVEGGLVALPPGESIPRRITQLTGLRDADLMQARSRSEVWGSLCEAASSRPLVVHYARFERAFVGALRQAASGQEGASPVVLRWLCTHEIARRLFPELPRRGLRALAGFFGYGLGELKRASGHVEATLAVWRGVIAVLEAEEGVTTLEELEDWLERVKARRGKRKVYPMPRSIRLALPETPGIYRMLGVGGEVLYLGKATSLKSRVNSYFQKQRNHSEKTLELLTRARDLRVTEMESPLEAALLETDEIKRLSPPYNIALRAERRVVCFANAACTSVSERADEVHVLGPLPSLTLPLQIGALMVVLSGADGAATSILDSAGPAGLPDEACWTAGLDAFRSAHGAVFGERPGGLCVQRLGAELWRERLAAAAAALEDAAEATVVVDDVSEDSQDEELEEWSWTPEGVQHALERLVRRWAYVQRRGRWLCLLSESRLVWRPRRLEDNARRVLVISGGRVEQRATIASTQRLPALPRCSRKFRARQGVMNAATYDRLRVLTTELRRVVSEEGDVALWLGPRQQLEREGLLRLLRWI